MLGALKSTRLLIVCLAVLIVLAFFYNEYRANNGGVLSSEVLNVIQSKTDGAGREWRDTMTTAGLPVTLPRGEVGILTFLAYKIIKPFVEVRVDYYISKLGLSDRIGKYGDKSIGLRVIDREIGSGHGLLCGQTIRAKVQETALVVNDSVARNTDTERMFTVGYGSAPLGLELGVLGMRVGGTRFITVPPELTAGRFASTKTNFIGSVEYKILLLDISPQYPESAYSLYYVDKVERLERRVVCGNLVLAQIRIIGNDGKVLYERMQPFKFRVGNHEAPLAIELGVLDMRVMGTRLIVAPSELLQLEEHIDREYAAMPLASMNDPSAASLIELTVLDAT